MHAVVKQLTKRAEEGVRQLLGDGPHLVTDRVPFLGNCAVLLCRDQRSESTDTSTCIYRLVGGNFWTKDLEHQGGSEGLGGTFQ